MDATGILAEISKILGDIGTADFYRNLARGGATVAAILAAFKLLQVILGRVLRGIVPEARLTLVKKAVRYSGIVVAVMTVFGQLGVDLTALLGAAGIVGVAVGFAAQTSVSNVISGLFLISEKSFQAGDVIQVGDVTGIVQAIDLLSIKLQTFDNRFVRIPNETLIKSNVVNVTRYPVRRHDVRVCVAYDSDLEKVKKALEEVARDNVWVLDNPEPLIVIENFGASGIDVLFGLWFEKSNMLNLRNSIMVDVKRRFDADGIEIAYPRLDVSLRGGPA